MCVKRMSSHSCLSRFSRFAIPTYFFCDFNIMYMYVLAAVVSFVPCYKFFGSTFLFNLPGFCTCTFVKNMHVMSFYIVFFWLCACTFDYGSGRFLTVLSPTVSV